MNKSITELKTIKELLQIELLSWRNQVKNPSTTLQDRKDAKEQIEKIHVCISNIDDAIHRKLYNFLENYNHA